MADARKKTPLWQIALLIGFGLGLSLLMIVVLLSLFPQLLPGDERNYAGLTMDVEFRLSDGDLFFHMPDDIKPIPPEEDIVLSAHTISWDDDGFRVPALEAENYSIVALGDSFTEGANVAVPWPDALAANLETPVQNYGFSGYGPYENAATAEEFFPDNDSIDWVLYAYFSGNDLSDANRGLDKELMVMSPLNMIPWLAQRAEQAVSQPQSENSTEEQFYKYPVPVIIGGNYYEMAFLEYMLWWQNFPPEGIEHTATYRIIKESFQRVEAASPEACHALIFLPMKEQVYYPYIRAHQWVNDNMQRVVAEDDAKISLEPAPFPEEEEPAFRENLLRHRDMMHDLADDLGWHFVDLLDPFTERIAQGDLLYYRYDGHWNQAGHDFAAEVIAESLQNAEGCS